MPEECHGRDRHWLFNVHPQPLSDGADNSLPHCAGARCRCLGVAYKVLPGVGDRAPARDTVTVLHTHLLPADFTALLPAAPSSIPGGPT